MADGAGESTKASEQGPAQIAAERLDGDGWLLFGQERVAPVAYLIEKHINSDGVVVGNAVTLSDHTISARAWAHVVLTLELADGRTIHGFLNEDGSALVRTGRLWPIKR